MAQRTFIFAGGGTGGHLFPGIAVANALSALEPDAGIEFFTTNRALDEQLLSRTPFRQTPQNVRPFPARPWSWPGFLQHWRKSVSAARERLRRQPATAVLGLGGYAAGPAVVAAGKMGLRTAILNPDAIPGRANRRLARHADLIVLQWARSRRYFSDDARCQVLGCPIRAEFSGIDVAAARRRFELDPQRPTVLITGASQGARTVNEAMALVWPALAKEHSEWQVLHLTGAADEQRVRDAYAAKNVTARVLAFTHDMHLALAAADVVVSRAGASTLAELTALGKPSVLLPYPYHRDRHQHANAQVLVDEGAALMLEDRCDAAADRGPLLAALERLLGDDAYRAQMRSAALRMSCPDAAKKVAEWMLGNG